MKYFGIKTPARDRMESYIWWITDDEHKSWYSFFQYPDKEEERYYHRSPLGEAIRAYEAIGYECVELEIKEVKKQRSV